MIAWWSKRSTQQTASLGARIVPAAVAFCPANLSTPSGIVVAAALIVGLRYDGWNLDVASAGVDGNERQVGRTHVLAVVRDVVFYPRLYSDLHRGAEYSIYRGAQDNQVSNVHRNPEIHVIDGGGDHVIAAMAMRGHGSGEVNPMHEASTE